MNQKKKHLDKAFFKKLPLTRNYEFENFLDKNDLDKDACLKESKEAHSAYAHFIIATLNDLGSSGIMKRFLSQQQGLLENEYQLAWLKSTKSLIQFDFKKSGKAESENYTNSLESIDKLIEINEISAENKKYREQKKESKTLEMSISKEDDYYAISFSDVQRHSTYDLKKNRSLVRKHYITELTMRLTKSLSPVEIEPFIQFQLKQVENKLEWLRYIDQIINRSNRERDVDPNSNDALLKVIIPNLISEQIGESEKGFDGISEKNSDEINTTTSTSDKLKADITMNELAYFFKVLLASGIIKEVVNEKSPWEKKNKAALSRIVNTFIKKADGTDFSEKAFRDAMDETKYNTYIKFTNLIDDFKKKHDEYVYDNC